MEKILILSIVLFLGLVAIHYRKKYIDEIQMKELERFYFNDLIKKKDKIIKELRKEKQND